MNAGVPEAVQVAALAASAVVLASTARRLPWHKLEGDREAQRVLLLATFGLAALRWFNADALAGSGVRERISGKPRVAAASRATWTSWPSWRRSCWRTRAVST